MRQKSHELQFLDVLYKRKALNGEEKKQYLRLKRGYEGEIDFDHMCAMFLGNDYYGLNDLTLKNQRSVVQIDKMIAHGDTLYLIDVKSYRGMYRFENSEWTVGNHVLTHNIYEQLRRAIRVVKEIFYEENLSMNVKGVLVFINPESQLEMIDPVEELTLRFDQIVPWLVELKNSAPSAGRVIPRWKAGETSNYQNKKWSPSTGSLAPHWKTVLGNYEIESYRTTRELDERRFEQLDKGICCERCGQCGVKESWHTVTCSCGHVEVREKAYVRTICEYGTLNHKKEIDKAGLKAFMGIDEKSAYLKRILEKHFCLKTAAGNSSTYVNRGMEYEYWFADQADYFKSLDKRLDWKRKRYH